VERGGEDDIWYAFRRVGERVVRVVVRGKEKPYIVVTVYFDRRLRKKVLERRKIDLNMEKNQSKDMPVISIVIPEDLKKEIEEFVREDGLEESAVLRKLLNMAMSEGKKEKAVKLLAEGKISYMKAVKKSGMNVWDFAEMVKERK